MGNPSEVKLDGVITSLSVAWDGAEGLVATSTGSLFRVRLQDLSFTVHAQLPTRPIHAVTFPHSISDQFISASGDGVRAKFFADRGPENKRQLGLLCMMRFLQKQ